MNTVRRSALHTTKREERLIAADAIIGLSDTPSEAKHTAASGIHTQL